MSIEVECAVHLYEINGEDPPIGVNLPTMTVRSHWNRNNLVVLEFQGKKVTVVAADLEAAIGNACRTGSR